MALYKYAYYYYYKRKTINHANTVIITVESTVLWCSDTVDVAM